MPIPYPRTCPYCGRTFDAQRPAGIYCSPACRVDGMNLRKHPLPPLAIAEAAEVSALRAEASAWRLRRIATFQRSKVTPEPSPQ